MPPNARSSTGRGQSHNSHRHHQHHRSSREQSALESYIPPYLRTYVLPYHGDFCCTNLFHPRLIVQLMAEGFLPIATDNVLLPKLHQQRCVISPLPDALHISRSTRKKSKRFTLTINQNLDAVVEGCRQQHGSHCWLVPPLVEAFSTIFATGETGMEATVFHDDGTKGTCPVRLYSIEVWSDSATTADDSDSEEHNPELVAGELGYSVGSIYTSLTGFSRQDSAGSVQLVALGHFLCLQGFTTWDLGMDMAYKSALGARLMPRADYVNLVHTVRERDANVRLPTLSEPINAKTLLDRRVCPVQEEEEHDDTAAKRPPSVAAGHKRPLENGAQHS